MRVHALTIVVCLFAGVHAASAQSNASIGVIGGPGWTNLSARGSDANDFSWQAGGAAGLYVISPSRRGVGVEPEVLWSVKRSSASGSSVPVTFRMTSLEIPVMLRVGAATPHRTAIHLLVGPTINIRLGARVITEMPGHTVDTDVSDQSHRSVFGLAMGGGVDVGRLRFDCRFTWALTDLNTHTSDNTSVKDHAFVLLAGVRLW